MGVRGGYKGDTRAIRKGYEGDTRGVREGARRGYEGDTTGEARGIGKGYEGDTKGVRKDHMGNTRGTLLVHAIRIQKSDTEKHCRYVELRETSDRKREIGARRTHVQT